MTPVLKGNQAQIAATGESIKTDCFYTLRNGDACQAGAVTEGIDINCCNTLRDRNARQAAAVLKGLSANACDTFRKMDFGQRCTVCKNAIRYAVQSAALLKDDLGQAGTVFKGIIKKRDYLLWNCNICQTTTVLKSPSVDGM